MNKNQDNAAYLNFIQDLNEILNDQNINRLSYY
jgi:hypothetical protein